VLLVAAPYDAGVESRSGGNSLKLDLATIPTIG